MTPSIEFFGGERKRTATLITSEQFFTMFETKEVSRTRTVMSAAHQENHDKKLNEVLKDRLAKIQPGVKETISFAQDRPIVESKGSRQTKMTHAVEASTADEENLATLAEKFKGNLHIIGI